MTERILLRFQKGALVPADQHALEFIRGRGWHIGDTVYAELRKPRNPQFHRMAHVLGRLCVENLDGWAHLSPHEALKRIQLEGGIGCEEIAYKVPRIGLVVQQIPHSLSFASMDETEFQHIYKAMCDYLSANYWPDLTSEQVAEMAELMDN